MRSLPVPVLAKKQDGRVGRRHLLHQLVDQLQGRTLADERRRGA